MAKTQWLRRLVGVITLVSVGLLADRAWFETELSGASSKSAECKRQLKSMMSQAMALDPQSPRSFSTIRAERGRYTYFLSIDEQLPLAPHDGDSIHVWDAGWPLPSGTAPGLTDAGLTFVCAGDIDGDEGFDVWSIASDSRVINSFEQPAFTPVHELDDLPPYRTPLQRLAEALSP